MAMALSLSESQAESPQVGAVESEIHGFFVFFFFSAGRLSGLLNSKGRSIKNDTPTARFLGQVDATVRFGNIGLFFWFGRFS